MMISFGNASCALSPINVPKMLQPKGLFFVRPSMGQYLHSAEELSEASEMLFEKIRSKKVKIEMGAPDSVDRSKPPKNVWVLSA